LLYRFQREVTDQGPAACLPRALSDEWLFALIRSADALFDGEDQATAGALALAAVLTILQGTQRSDQLLSTDVLSRVKVINDFRIELALELAHRRTDVRYEWATLRTIFTNREVCTWREDPTTGRRSKDSQCGGVE
jgi:hypothetical protein